MIVDELVTLLEFDVKGKDKAESFNLVIQKIEDSAKALVLSLTAAITSVAYFADRVSKEITDNYEWAKSVGVAVDSYQRFEHAAEIVGGSLGDIKGDLEGWVRTAKASGMTLEEVFLREAEAIEGMTAEQSHALLSARGYSETSIRMIQQGEGKLQEFLSQAEVIPEKHLQAAKDYAITWRQVTSEVSKAMNAAVASALPYIQSILKGVRDFIRTNKELFKSSVTVFFKSFAIVLMAFLKPLKLVIQGIFFLLRAFDKITFGIGKYIIVIEALTVAFTMLAIAMVMKTAKGVALLMGKFTNMIGVLAKAIDYTTGIILKITTMGVKQAFLNSQLVIATKAWWANTKAVWANLGVSLKNLGAQIKELWFIRVMNSHIGINVRYWWMQTKAKIKNALVTASLSIKEGIHNAAMIVKNGLLKAQIFLYHKLWLRMLTYIAAVGKAIASGVTWAASIVGSIIPALITMGKTIRGTVIPAIGAAATAIWGFTTALLANPITWIVIGVVAAVAELVAEVYLVWKYWDKIVDWLKRAWNTCKGFFNTLYDGCKTIYNWIVDGILKAIDAAWDAGMSVAKSIKDFIFGAINDIIDLINLIPGVDIEKVGEVDLTDRDKMMQSIRGQFAPAGTVPVQYTGVAQVPSNNYQNSRSYVDQRNITINTNATSGPAIASYMKSNDLVRGGYGASGVW